MDPFVNTRLERETKCPIDNVCHFMDKRQLSDQIKSKRIYESVESVVTQSERDKQNLSKKQATEIPSQKLDKGRYSIAKREPPFTLMLVKKKKK